LQIYKFSWERVMILRARGRAYLVEGVTLEERLGAFAVVDVLDLPVRSHGRAATAAASPAKKEPPPPLKTRTVLQYAHNKRHAEREREHESRAGESSIVYY
jgi:hypothetical protein